METGSTTQEQDATRPRASPPALSCLVHLQVSAFSVGIDAINRRDGTVNRGLYSVADRVLRVRADPRPDPSSCFLAGESAGGNIIHHAANRWAAPRQPTPNSVRLAGIISVQPYFGGEERTESELRLDGVATIVSLRRADFWWRAFLPEGASRDHPAAHVTEENAGLAEAFPPAMVLVGGFDPLQDWQRRYADVLRRKGKTVEVVEFPEGIHAFYLFPNLPDTAGAIECMRTFVESNRTSSSASRVPLAGTKLIENGL